MFDSLPASVQPSVRCFLPSWTGFLRAGQQTAPAAGSSSHCNNNIKRFGTHRRDVLVKVVTCRKGSDVHAVPVDVVHRGLWFQSAGVNPEEHQRTSLLVMENLEGQSTEVALVPPPAGRGQNGQSSMENYIKTTLKQQFQHNESFCSFLFILHPVKQKKVKL